MIGRMHAELATAEEAKGRSEAQLIHNIKALQAEKGAALKEAADERAAAEAAHVVHEQVLSSEVSRLREVQQAVLAQPGARPKAEELEHGLTAPAGRRIEEQPRQEPFCPSLQHNLAVTEAL